MSSNHHTQRENEIIRLKLQRLNITERINARRNMQFTSVFLRKLNSSIIASSLLELDPILQRLDNLTGDSQS